MKTFIELTDAKKFLELAVIGVYGYGLTRKDLLIDLKHITKRTMSIFKDVFIVIRETGTLGLYFTLDVAVAEFKRWSTSRSIVHINLLSSGAYLLETIEDESLIRPDRAKNDLVF